MTLDKAKEYFERFNKLYNQLEEIKQELKEIMYDLSEQDV